MNYFPRKEYKDVIYEEGEYESLVVEIGDAKGDNFWCVLFPPLCLLEGEEENKESIKYTSFIKEIIDKYF
jgi:stage II sporulation protein R